MNSFIEYFYGIKAEKIICDDKYYSFVYKGNLYRLYLYDDNYNKIKSLYELNKQLLGNTLVSEIIPNRMNEIISIYNRNAYILIKLFVNTNKNISLKEISFLANSIYREKLNINWGILWSNKIDYLENLINENGKKYPLIVDSFNYFVGLAENAISYFNSIVLENNYKFVISHKTIKFGDSVDVLYNPLNIIFDYKSRDVAEYIKNSFFNKNYNIFNELKEYLINNNLSYMEIQLLIARLLYPSFYFEMYEDILIDNKEERILFDIILKLDDYEIFLSKVISFLKSIYDIEEIAWIKKASINFDTKKSS